MTISLHELADQARIPADELRQRLVHAGIGYSGHGDAYEARVRALVHEIAKETGGVVANAVVVEAHNDDARAGAACTTLQKRLAYVFVNLPQERMTLQEWEDVKATPHKIWLAREPHQGPSGGIEHTGWGLHVAIPNDAHRVAWRVVHDLPTQIDGLDLYAVAWDQAPDNLTKG